ncbi:hypothetical protein CJ030_MR8G009795 [Morella rubra]|uniref:Transmembrane protein n=1 Tax=Morella rubra TaxID=262757 RepID=A0A6A1UPU8_9ROSI|nr:hypothetical protein CJ030_MR8G009795 [Morella rubra]
MASEVNILPPPLNLVVGEIGGGDRNGGAVWFWKIFGGGSFDGWSSKRKRKALLLGFLGICGLGLLFGKELERNVLGGFLGFWLLGRFLIQWWEKRRTKDWLLGFCLGVVFVGLGLKKDQMQNIVERIMVCSPMMDVGRRGRRKGGRGL